MRSAIALCLLVWACSPVDTIDPDPPRTDRAALSFTGAAGEPDPAPQTLRLEVETSHFWRAKTTANWIVVLPDTGSGPASIAVSIRPLLLVGDVTDTIRITSRSGVVEVPVQLHRTGRPARGLLYSIPYLVGYDSIFVAGPDGSGARAISFPYDVYPGTTRRDVILPHRGAVFDPSGEKLGFVALLNCCLAGSYVFISKADGTAAGSNWGAFRAPGGTCRGLFGGVTWSPDGQALAGPCGYTIEDRLVIDSLATGRATSVRLSGGRGLVAWSPDGTWILVGNGLVSPDRTRPDTTLQLPNGLSGIGWTPDGRIIIAGSCGSGVYIIGRGAALAGPATPPRVLGHEYNYATFSPDGRKLLALRCLPSPGVELMDADGMNVTWTMPGANWAAWRR